MLGGYGSGVDHQEERKHKLKESKRLEREYYEARIRQNPRLARNKKFNTQIIDRRGGNPSEGGSGMKSYPRGVDWTVTAKFGDKGEAKQGNQGQWNYPAPKEPFPAKLSNPLSQRNPNAPAPANPFHEAVDLNKRKNKEQGVLQLGFQPRSIPMTYQEQKDYRRKKEAQQKAAIFSKNLERMTKVNQQKQKGNLDLFGGYNEQSEKQNQFSRFKALKTQKDQQRLRQKYESDLNKQINSFLSHKKSPISTSDRSTSHFLIFQSWATKPSPPL